MPYPLPEDWMANEYGQTAFDPVAAENATFQTAAPEAVNLGREWTGVDPSSSNPATPYELAAPGQGPLAGPDAPTGKPPVNRGPAPAQLPAQAAPQFGGYYMPPPEERIAIQNELQRTGAIPNDARGLDMLASMAKQGQAYDQSLPGREAALMRQQYAGQAGQVGLEQQGLGIQDQQAQAQAAIQAQRQKSLEIMQAEDQERRASAQRAMAGAQQKYSEASDNLAKTEVDPDRWWNEKSTGTKVLLAISAALGAFGSGLTGAPNMAAQMIQSAIDRDMEAQKAGIANREKGLEAQQGLMARMREFYQTDDDAANAAKAFVLQRTAMQVEQLGSEAASDEARLQSQKLSAALLDQGKQLELGLQLTAAQRAEQEQQARLQAQAGAAQAQAQRQRQAELLDYAEWDDKARERAVPSFGLMAPTAADATKIKDSAVLAQQITGTTDEMQRLIDSGASTYGSQQSAEYDAKRGIIMAAVNVMLGQGAISKDDATRVEMSIPEAKTLGRNANAKAALQQTGNYVNGMVRSNLIQRGAVPYERVQMLDAKGNPKNMYREMQAKPQEDVSGDLKPVQ
jgi:hypothetical protein